MDNFMATLKQDLAFVVDKMAFPITGKGLEDMHTMDHVCLCLGLKTKAAQQFLQLAMANAVLMDKKQLDYGPRNISSFGTFGVTVRMNDKMERIKTLFNKGKRRRAVNESIQDTFRDISNYAIIALMLELEMWPNE